MPVDTLLWVKEALVEAAHPYNHEKFTPWFRKVSDGKGPAYVHRENDFVDFERDRLLFRMLSNEGPHMAVGDVNGDGREDVFLCGAKDMPGALFVQDDKGRFRRRPEEAFIRDKVSEDTDCAFLDADNDGDRSMRKGWYM